MPEVGRFDRCPKAWLRDDAGDASQLIHDFGFMRQHGVMPRSGGLLDQDPRYVEAASVIAEEAHRITEKQRAAQQRRREAKR